MDHKLTITANPVAGYDGACDCSNPDHVGEGVYVGQVTFHGSTRDAVVFDHADHMFESGVRFDHDTLAAMIRDADLDDREYNVVYDVYSGAIIEYVDFGDYGFFENEHLTDDIRLYLETQDSYAVAEGLWRE